MRMSHQLVKNCIKGIAALAVASSLGACNFLSASGPYSTEIRSQATQDTDGVNYKLVPVTAQVVSVLSAYSGEGLIGTFRNDQKSIPDVRIGSGDIVAISIFEASSGGLFIPAEAASRAGNFVDIPTQTVDRNGFISMPYAGQIKAAGRLPWQVENEIVEKLKNRAIDPQVVVSVREQRSSTVTVLGEVIAPAKFPLTAAGERVLDALSRAGALGNNGTSAQKGYNMFVTLQRGGREATISFNRLIRDSSNNINLQPGDTLYVYARPRTFLAFGATGKQGQYPFEDDSISLSEAVAKAEGLHDEKADPQSVFMFRVEDRETLRRMGVDVSDVPEGKIPTIYTVNLREPTGFLLSTKMVMRDKDIIYVANSGSTELTKFLTIVLLGASTAREIAEAEVLFRTR